MISPDAQITADNAETFLEQLEQGIADPNETRKEVIHTGAVSDLFDQTILTRIEALFASSLFGHYTLPAQTFCSIIAEYIPASLVENIYRSIDVNDVGYVQYADFTNYLIASEAGSSFSAKNFIARLVLSFNQEDDLFKNHRDAIDCLLHVKRPYPMLISGGRDGQLSIWDPDSLQLMKSIDHRDKNSVYSEELNKSMDTMLKAQTKRLAAVSTAKPAKVAITSMCPLFNWGLLCVGSADCSMTLYELSNQDVCGRLTAMECIPTAIECFQRPCRIFDDSRAGSDGMNAFIAIGDSAGHLHVIRLHEEFGSSIEVGMKKKNQMLFAQSVQKVHKVRIQSDWITKMVYISEVNALVAASADSSIAFVDVDKWAVTKVFSGHAVTNLGIRSFSWSGFNKYIVSGADRVMLFWDAFTLDVINRIDNLRSPIVAVEVYDSHNKIFAALLNKTIMSWHNITLEALQVIVDSTLYKPVNTLAAMTFVPDRQVMYTAGNKITVWTLEKSTEGADNHDEEDLCVTLYNQRFNQVIVVRTLGTVKVYQAETGEIRIQFLARPIDQRTLQPIAIKKDQRTGVLLPLITHAALDKNQTRLIVCGADFSVQYWNVHDGSNLLQVLPQLFPTSLAHELSSMSTNLSMVFQDVLVPDSKVNEEDKVEGPTQAVKPTKALLLGTESGHICVYHEKGAAIEAVPAAFLRLTEGEELLCAKEINVTLAPAKASLALVVKKLIHQTRAIDAMIPDKPEPPPKAAEVNREPRARRASLAARRKEMAATISAHAPRSAIVVKPKDTESRSGPVIWMKVLAPSTLIVGYGAGRVVLWDLTNDHKIGDLRTNAAGAILNGMKMKSKLNGTAAAADTTAMLAAAAQEVHNIHQTEGEAEGDQAAAHNSQREEIMKMAHLNNDFDEFEATSSTDPINRRLSMHGRRASTVRAMPAKVINSVIPNANAKAEAKMALPALIPVQQLAQPAGTADSDEDGSINQEAPPAPSQRTVTKPMGRRDSAAMTMSKHRNLLAVKPSEIVAMEMDSSPSTSTIGNEEPSVHFIEAIAVPELAVRASDAAEQVANAKRSIHTMRKWTVRFASHDGDSAMLPIMLQSMTSPTLPAKKAQAPSSMAPITIPDQEQHNNHHDHLQASHPEPPAERISVDCLVVLVKSNIMIGACSDRNLRFWDLETKEVLCSCLYLPSGIVEAAVVVNTMQHGQGVDLRALMPEEIIRHLQASDSEDLLLGAYDSGMVRIWSIQAYSIQTLKNLLQKHLYQQAMENAQSARNKGKPAVKVNKEFGAGMSLAVSPLTLLAEWQAHDCPVLSVDYVWFDYESKADEDEGYPSSPKSPGSSPSRKSPSPPRKTPSAANISPVKGRDRRDRQFDVGSSVLEGYALTAGLDQRVYLWSLTGKCVGEFGTYGWDINNEETWGSKRPSKVKGGSKGMGKGNGALGMAPHAPSSSRPSNQLTARHITKESMEMKVSPSTTFLNNFIRQRKTATAPEMTRYIEELSKKMIHRPPSYTDADTHFRNLTRKHPVVVVKPLSKHIELRAPATP